jgi:hypothetical protein
MISANSELERKRKGVAMRFEILSYNFHARAEENHENHDKWCLLGCYAVWFLQEPHGVTTQKTPFFIVTAAKTSNLTKS